MRNQITAAVTEGMQRIDLSTPDAVCRDAIRAAMQHACIIASQKGYEGGVDEGQSSAYRNRELDLRDRVRELDCFEFDQFFEWLEEERNARFGGPRPARS